MTWECESTPCAKGNGYPGGFLGLDETPLAVNWKDVKIGSDIDYVNTPITVESLEK